MEKITKNARILNIYARLCEGKVIKKREEAERFHVDERSIQRDIDDIREFLAENEADCGDTRKVIYNRAKEGFVLEGFKSSLMNNDEILAVSKILLESRAFTKQEIGTILDKLIAGCVPQINIKLVTDLILNEKFHYVELHHKSNVKDKLWQIGEEIRECRLLEIIYEKQIAVIIIVFGEKIIIYYLSENMKIGKAILIC